MKKEGFLNKKEFIAKMAEIHGMKKVDASAATEIFLATLYYMVSNGINVRLLGDFIMETKTVKERSFPNPQDRKETVTIPEHKKVVLKLGNRMQALANGASIAEIYGYDPEELN